MNLKRKGERVGIFIDTQNLYHSAKNLYNARVNFGNIAKEALGDRELVRAIAYAITTESGDELNFLEALRKVGIEIKSKDLQIFAGGAKKADWDVGIAVDMIKIAPRLDTLVLVCGDGDFIPVIQYLQHTFFTRIEVVAFGKSTSAKLREVADDFIDLSLSPRKYLLRQGPSSGARTSTRSSPRYTQSRTTPREERE
ncbi:MAG: NYN domain-containing protein [bacterium]|nr:NYN domain-containing protein [bacterium]